MTINTHKGLYACKRLMYGLNGAPAFLQHYFDRLFQAVVNAPVPRNVHEVKSFLGLVNFYGKFCENLTTIANPLNNLTKKNVRFLWSKDCQVAFEQIKKEINSLKVLVHYDLSLPLTLASDASPVGIGCVLSHVYPDGSERPIAFASRTFSGSEKKYSQIDKEALLIVWAVKKFYLYLKGRRFTLITDHKPLIAIFGSKTGLPVLAATRLSHYALILQSFESLI
ncbi:retrovirus-related Pol polyprotein from transposon 412 [Trichonephila clavipes]|nr:retrovirus-related Pol polyprotein from transposon 412 [Trichonephila clavipes]